MLAGSVSGNRYHWRVVSSTADLSRAWPQSGPPPDGAGEVSMPLPPHASSAAVTGLADLRDAAHPQPAPIGIGAQARRTDIASPIHSAHLGQARRIDAGLALAAIQHAVSATPRPGAASVPVKPLPLR